MKSRDAVLIAVIAGSLVGYSYSAVPSRHGVSASINPATLGVPGVRVVSNLSNSRPAVDHCPGPHLERNVCYIRVIFENNERKVFSHNNDVDAECSCMLGPPSCFGNDDCHSCPFGNWGVDSTYGSRSDTTQFRGWQSVDASAKREWNSCTSSYEYYNNGPEQQRQASWPDDPRQWAGGWFEWEVEDEEEGCGALDGAPISFGSVAMNLYELDLFVDEFVNTLTYPTHAMTLDCPNQGTCDGTSQWYTRSGYNPNPEIDAKSRIIVTGSYFEHECIEF